MSCGPFLKCTVMLPEYHEVRSWGTLTTTPPTLLIRSGKPWKLTSMTWLTGTPVKLLTTLMASGGPPQK